MITAEKTKKLDDELYGPFVDEMIVPVDYSRVSSKDLFNCYTAWLHARGLSPSSVSTTRKAFTQRILGVIQRRFKKSRIVRIRPRGETGFFGIALRVTNDF